MVPTTPGPQRKRLGARLREIRAARYRSGSALAEALGWQQSRVSKLETGVQLPTAEDLDRWVAACSASTHVRAELGDLLTAARLDYRTWQDTWQCRGGIAVAQAGITAEELAATRIVEFQPAIVPGLVQTPVYARELLSAPGGPVLLGADEVEIEGLVAARDRRQQQLLYAPGKRIQIVIGEAALRIWFGTRGHVARAARPAGHRRGVGHSRAGGDPVRRGQSGAGFYRVRHPRFDCGVRGNLDRGAASGHTV
ncbi:MAG: helix-turn-helix transcriptional regulator [Pseudonocardia sp.]|nr:helix-turn-helix transcriptional regulator [Pseudonocardia sp.]